MDSKRFLIVMVLVFGWGFVDGAIVSESFVFNGIEYYMQVSDSVFDLGEDVETFFKVTNRGYDALRLEASRPLIGIIISKEAGGTYNAIWDSNWDKLFDPGTESFVLRPGESIELSATWSQIDLNNSSDPQYHRQAAPGRYRMSGYFRSVFGRSIINTSSIPEPATLLLIGLGGLFIRRR